MIKGNKMDGLEIKDDFYFRNRYDGFGLRASSIIRRIDLLHVQLMNECPPFTKPIGKF